MFEYACIHGLYDGLNPATKMQMPVDKSARERRAPFTLDELNKLMVDDSILKEEGTLNSLALRDELYSIAEQEDLDAITIFEDMPLAGLDPQEAEERIGRPLDASACPIVDDWGIVWGQTEFDIPYPIGGPIRSADDLRTYAPPDPDADYSMDVLEMTMFAKGSEMSGRWKDVDGDANGRVQLRRAAD